jgi:hypothetical protein
MSDITNVSALSQRMIEDMAARRLFALRRPENSASFEDRNDDWHGSRPDHGRGQESPLSILRLQLPPPVNLAPHIPDRDGLGRNRSSIQI